MKTIAHCNIVGINASYSLYLKTYKSTVCQWWPFEHKSSTEYILTKILKSKQISFLCISKEIEQTCPKKKVNYRVAAFSATLFYLSLRKTIKIHDNIRYSTIYNLKTEGCTHRHPHKHTLNHTYKHIHTHTHTHTVGSVSVAQSLNWT